MKTFSLPSNLSNPETPRLPLRHLLRLPRHPVERVFRRSPYRAIIEDLMEGLCPPELATELLPRRVLRLYREMVRRNRQRRKAATAILLLYLLNLAALLMLV